MKTYAYSLFVFLVLAMLFSGCAGSGGGNTSGTVTPSPPKSTEQLINEEIQKQGANWTAAENPISRLSTSEKEELNGAMPETPSGQRISPKIALSELPTSLDWRSKDGSNWVTSIKNQSVCGSCVAFASLAVTETLHRISGGSANLSADLSESELFSCGGGSCSVGWLLSSAATRLKDTGAVDESCLPYQAQDNMCQYRCSDWQSRLTKTDSWNWVIADAASIKTALQQGPLLASIYVYEDFFYYKSGVYQHVYGSKPGGHAIAIVGYNDEGQYWIVKNSWDTTWGESGYVKIKYGQINIEQRVIAMQMESTQTDTWAKTFGGTQDDSANSVQQTSDGGYIIAGYTFSEGQGYNDIQVMKLDGNGEQVWGKTFGGADEDFGESVLQTSDGGYVVAGCKDAALQHDISLWEGDVWVIKLDSSGNKVWDNTYGEDNFYLDLATSIQETSGGGFILAGMTIEPGTDFLVMKLDSSGNEVWKRNFDGGNSHDMAASIKQTTDEGYIVAGLSGSIEDIVNNKADIWILKLDSSGTQTWEKTFSQASFEGGEIQQTSDGGYIFVGSLYSQGGEDYDLWILKLDASGNKTWDKTFGGSLADSANSVQQTSNGGYVVAGYTKSEGSGDKDVWVLKLDSSGNQTWAKTYGGTAADGASSVQQTTDGGYIVSGTTNSYGAGESDFWILKLDENGNCGGCF
ncbi:MAG: C1 family peptidase [bacterium]